MNDVFTYDARTVANWFVARARKDGSELTIMAILKLIYIAHGWHLEIYDLPLFKNRIEAWRFGPVVRDVYKSFRKQGEQITEEFRVKDDHEIGERQGKFLESVYSVYGDMGAYQLSRLTHVRGGPWDLATEVYGHYAVISDALIKKHYQLKRAEAERRKEVEEHEHEQR